MTRRQRDYRILFDFSTSLRAAGPAVGIVRAEREFARFGLAHQRDFALVCFAPAERRFRMVEPRFAELFIDHLAQLDTIGLPDPSRPRATDRMPPALRPALFWILKFHRKVLQTLERRRLKAADPSAAARIARMQQALMTPKHRKLMTLPDGRQRPLVPYDMIWQQPVAFGPDDVLTCAGAGWAFGDIDVVVEAKRRYGFRLVVMCYDIIPILFPQYYTPTDAAAFRLYMEAVFAAADLVVVNSQKIREDVIAYCATQNIPLGSVAVVPLGADFSHWSSEPATLPDGLEPGRYVLYVSTLEPRKNHRLLHSVWRRLVEEGVVARSSFKLVFVGRQGWLVDDLVAEITEDARTSDTLVRFEGLDDRSIAALYGNAAFCCYPSAYEGYGLPVLEAFHFGKAVLASAGGSLPEVVRDLSPCLDPADPEAWYRALKTWIEDPSVRAPYEERIRTSFQPPTWQEAATRLFSSIQSIFEDDPADAARPPWTPRPSA